MSKGVPEEDERAFKLELRAAARRRVVGRMRRIEHRPLRSWPGSTSDTRDSLVSEQRRLILQNRFVHEPGRRVALT